MTIKGFFVFVQAFMTLKDKEIIVWEDFKHGGSYGQRRNTNR